jgi:hypothetical protein
MATAPISPISDIDQSLQDVNQHHSLTAIPTSISTAPNYNRHLNSSSLEEPESQHVDSESFSNFTEKRSSATTARSSRKPLLPKDLPWLLEASGLVLSWATFLPMIGILVGESGKPIDHWKISWSINAILSILSTAAAMSMTFAVASALSQRKWNRMRQSSRPLRSLYRYDEASRGPIGSIKLIFHLRFK